MSAPKTRFSSRHFFSFSLVGCAYRSLFFFPLLFTSKETVCVVWVGARTRSGVRLLREKNIFYTHSTVWIESFTCLPAPQHARTMAKHLAFVFIGHVDSGKSTTAGQLLYLTGQVDERTIGKNEQEAKEKAGASWSKAFLMDTNEEERMGGKTVEVGRAYFKTESRRYTILDAPGHKNYVPNMIEGLACADAAVLIVSARKGEFESGLNRGGQTREHALLAKTLGINALIVAINKMDDDTVQWSRERFDEICTRLKQYLRTIGYPNVVYVPISGFGGQNLLEPDPRVGWESLTLVQALDASRLPRRNAEAPLRMPIRDAVKDGGSLYLGGKIEAGTIAVGQQVVLIPSNAAGTVQSISSGHDIRMLSATAGDLVTLHVHGIEDAREGSVLYAPEQPVGTFTRFEAHISIIDLPSHRPVVSPGCEAVMHIHTATVECKVERLLCLVDHKTGEETQEKKRFLRKGDCARVCVELGVPVCLQLYEALPRLGRFTLRDSGVTVAVGRVVRLPKGKTVWVVTIPFLHPPFHARFPRVGWNNTDWTVRGGGGRGSAAVFFSWSRQKKAGRWEREPPTRVSRPVDFAFFALYQICFFLRKKKEAFGEKRCVWSSA